MVGWLRFNSTLSMQIVAKTNDCIKKYLLKTHITEEIPTLEVEQKFWWIISEATNGEITKYVKKGSEGCHLSRFTKSLNIQLVLLFSNSLYTPSQAASFVRYIPVECRRAVCCRALWVGLQTSATASKCTQTHSHLVTNIHNSSAILAQLTGTVSLSSCMALSAGQSPREMYSRSMLSTNGVCESC